MRGLVKLQHVIFDFDGVLAETNQVRVEGFKTLFSSFPDELLDSFVAYVRANGGLSRYSKIRYFFEFLLQQPVSEEQVNLLAAKYSALVTERVITADAVRGSREFLSRWAGYLDFAIISGSDEQELQFVCSARGIARFFSHIFGSPSTKQDNFKRLFEVTGWQRHNCLYIGDSINDLNAANDSCVPFLARASGFEAWQTGELTVIPDLTELEAVLSISNL